MSEPSRSLEELIAFVEGLKRKWVATIDALVDPLMIVAKDFTIVKANKAMAAACLHKEIPSIIGKKCYEVFAEAKAPCPGCRLLEAAETGKACHFHLSHVRKKYFEVSSQPLYDQAGALEGCVHIYRDRTEAKALQEQLFQSEKLASIGLLAGGIAHEINNPLGGILIFSQMLLREMPADSPHYEDVREIEAATQRCKSIVSRLLEFARSHPTNVTADSRLVQTDVNEAAKSALRFAKVHPYAKKVELIEEWWPEPLLVVGERNKFIQLFLNLMQNAFQAMPDGGSLILRSRREERQAQSWGVWEVEDTGIGIAEENLHKIFDPFFTTKEPGEGTGLGLSICYSICQEAGGTIEVSSTVNEGTVFLISLPLATEKARSLVSQ